MEVQRFMISKVEKETLLGIPCEYVPGCIPKPYSNENLLIGLGLGAGTFAETHSWGSRDLGFRGLGFLRIEKVLNFYGVET